MIRSSYHGEFQLEPTNTFSGVTYIWGTITVTSNTARLKLYDSPRFSIQKDEFVFTNQFRLADAFEFVMTYDAEVNLHFSLVSFHTTASYDMSGQKILSTTRNLTLTIDTEQGTPTAKTVIPESSRTSWAMVEFVSPGAINPSSITVRRDGRGWRRVFVASERVYVLVPLSEKEVSFEVPFPINVVIQVTDLDVAQQIYDVYDEKFSGLCDHDSSRVTCPSDQLVPQLSAESQVFTCAPVASRQLLLFKRKQTGTQGSSDLSLSCTNGLQVSADVLICANSDVLWIYRVVGSQLVKLEYMTQSTPTSQLKPIVLNSNMIYISYNMASKVYVINTAQLSAQPTVLLCDGDVVAHPRHGATCLRVASDVPVTLRDLRINALLWTMSVDVQMTAARAASSFLFIGDETAAILSIANIQTGQVLTTYAGPEGSRFGSTIAVEGSVCAVAAPSLITKDFPTTGAVYLFSCVETKDMGVACHNISRITPRQFEFIPGFAGSGIALKQSQLYVAAQLQALHVYRLESGVPVQYSSVVFDPEPRAFALSLDGALVFYVFNSSLYSFNTMPEWISCSFRSSSALEQIDLTPIGQSPVASKSDSTQTTALIASICVVGAIVMILLVVFVLRKTRRSTKLSNDLSSMLEQASLELVRRWQLKDECSERASVPPILNLYVYRSLSFLLFIYCLPTFHYHCCFALLGLYGFFVLLSFCFCLFIWCSASFCTYIL